MKISLCVPLAVLLFLLSCDSKKQAGERIAKQACGSCHAFPDPALLSKHYWDKKVLPEMAFRMGLTTAPLSTITFEDQIAVISSIASSPMVSDEQWQAIRDYYLTNAPDTLMIADRKINDDLDNFDAEPVRFDVGVHQGVTVIYHDPARKRILVGTRPGKLYEFDQDFVAKDSIQLTSSPSKILHDEKGNDLVLEMGIMDPNEQARGRIASLSRNGNKRLYKGVLDSLQRPVDFIKVDLNKDGLDDYVVCNFGNYTGSLMAYQALANGKYRPYPLQRVPGARRVIVEDFDKNGFPDILALLTQGDERIVMFYNQGSFQFRLASLLRFDAINGSSYLDTADFNNDGKFDLLYTNGDNADYSATLKPYHGVRVFLNNGSNGFKESYFYPMHGAGQARAVDFDQDGDLDIAAISFFPDFDRHPEQGFIYLENTGQGFAPKVTPLANTGRWLDMETGDIDNDGDVDIMLGSLTFPNQVPTDLFNEWRQKRISILVLRNKKR